MRNLQEWSLRQSDDCCVVALDTHMTVKRRVELISPIDQAIKPGQQSPTRLNATLAQFLLESRILITILIIFNSRMLKVTCDYFFLPVIYWWDSTRFYGTNGMCFPLHIDDPYLTGWEYSAFIFLGINTIG